MTLMEEQTQFFSRVVALPVVTDALGQMTSLYTETRERSHLLRLAESGVLKAVSTAKPVISHLEKPIEVLNSFACEKLDKLEESYPIITKPTDKVYDATLKPTVERMLAITSISSDKLGDVQGYTSGKLTGVRDLTNQTAAGVGTYARSTLQWSTDRALRNPATSAIFSRVGEALDTTNRYVDYYLPVVVEEDEDEVEGEKRVVEEGSEGESDEHSPLGQALTVSSKVYQRLSHRLGKQLRHLQSRSQESLKNLNFTVNLIDYAKTNVDSVQGSVTSAGSKVKYWWDEINREEKGERREEDQNSPALTRGFEATVLAQARQATQRLKQGFETVRTVLPALPSPIQSRITQAHQYVSNLYTTFSQANSFSELPQRVVVEMKGQVTAIQDSLASLSQYISSFYSSLMDRIRGTQKSSGEETEEGDNSSQTSRMEVVPSQEENHTI